MALSDLFADRMFYTNTKQYSERNGNVAYLDASGLRRPFAMPKAQRVIAAVIVVVAIIIGYTIVDRTLLDSYRQAEAVRTSIESNLAREASIESLPNMPSIVALDNEATLAAFTDAGVQAVDLTALNDSYDMMICKVPADMTPDETSALYAKGIGALDAVEATKLLNGSWMLTADRENGTTVVRYVDFKTADPQIAVQNAIAKEGFDAAAITETGVDDSGNTYSLGTVETDNGTCIWKVSALPFDDIYSISGMPEGACYVGVRLTYA